MKKSLTEKDIYYIINNNQEIKDNDVYIIETTNIIEEIIYNSKDIDHKFIDIVNDNLFSLI